MPVPGAIFRAGAREVLVDVEVTDKKGNFRRDLAQQDFRILEDGREQKISSFEIEGKGVPGSSGKRFIALVFDSERPGLREEVARFVDLSSAPGLYMAVFSRLDGRMRLQQAFTSDAGRIKAALHEMRVSTGSPLEGAFPLAAHNPLTDRISSVVADLAQIRGWKALILFGASWSSHRGSGVPQNPNDPWLKTVDDCNAAGVSIYSFINSDNIGGSPISSYAGPGNGTSDHATDTDLIYTLVAGTGGKYTPAGKYDLAAYLRKTSDEQSHYYLLGYVPAGDSTGKPCHKLKVRVNASGVDVKSRNSYCVSAEPAAASITPSQMALQTKAASGVKGSVAAGLQVSWFRSDAQMAAVEIDMDIDPAAMKMRGRLQGEIDVSGTVRREDGSVAAQFGDTVEKRFDSEAQLDAFLKTPYHYAKQFRVTPGRYNVVVATGSADGAFGTAKELLDIHPWISQTLSVSGIALGMTDYPAATAAAELDDSILRSRGPHTLASMGRVLRPLGSTQFPAGQNGLFYFEVI